MNVISKLVLSGAAVVAAAAASVAYTPTASAAEVVVYPSDAYIAAYTPIWYNGYAHYFWRNHWYYRDHGVWHGYAHQPAVLWGRRGEWGSHYHRW